LPNFLESPIIPGKPVLDETHLRGEHDIDANVRPQSAIQTLQEFGLPVTRDRRTIEVIGVPSTL